MAIYGGFFGKKFVRNSKNSQMGGVKRLNSVGRKNHNLITISNPNLLTNAKKFQEPNFCNIDNCLSSWCFLHCWS